MSIKDHQILFQSKPEPRLVPWIYDWKGNQNRLNAWMSAHERTRKLCAYLEKKGPATEHFYEKQKVRKKSEMSVVIIIKSVDVTWQHKHACTAQTR
jgi:hypothetical protein